MDWNGMDKTLSFNLIYCEIGLRSLVERKLM